MNTIELLAELARRNITLWSEHDKLRYKAPPGALTSELRGALVSHKAALLPFLPALGGNDTPSPAGARPEPLEGPMSPAQRTQWFLHRTTPDSPTPHVAFALRLHGTLDLAAVETALRTLVARHPVLRTTYRQTDAEPQQRVHAVPDPGSMLAGRLERVAAEGWDDARLTAELQASLHRPFDLEHGPVLRATLFSLAPREHVLLLTVHHIAADGWSLWILVDELRQLYAAARRGVAPSLPPPGVSYLGHAAAQLADAEGPRRAASLEHWSRQLAGVPTVLELLGDRPRPATHRNRGATCSFDLDPALTDQLARLARARSTTLATVLMAAWQVLLQRSSGQDDFVVGTPVYGREGAELTGVVGDFVNVVPVRAALGHDPTFAEHLDRVRRDLLDAIDHADCPLPDLVNHLHVPRELRRPPLVQVLFVMQAPQLGRDLVAAVTSPSAARVGFGDIEASVVPVDQQEGQFDLVLEIVDPGRDSGHGLHGSLKHNTDVFHATSARRLVAGLTALLRAVVAEPSAPTSALVAHDQAELERVLATFNATARPFPADATVHGRIIEQARRTPDAIAVQWGERRLAYRELLDRAQALADRLRRRGVGPEVCVATCLERSPELIIAFLAVLMAGGAYVPLDPSYPQDRLRFMMTDVRASLLLSDREHAERVSAGDERAFAVVLLDEPEHDDASSPAQASDRPEATAQSLAYVLYTSGSTGRPKGVMVTHRAILRLCFDHEFVPLQASDRVAQVCNASFDVATFEIWAPLLHGACVVGVPKEVLLAPPRLARLIVEQQPTVMFVVPTVFNQTVRELPRAFASLDTLIVGGEALDPRWTQHALRHGPPRRLVNGYGPTECTGFATWHLVEHVEEGVDGTLASIPIGRPIANTQAYVLDRALRPLPVGVPGQLYLGGDGLARGYFERPELDRERFVGSPFDPAARLYATGDLVRMLADGTLEYLGRIDHQVKIRGVRIELGEIEAALAELPSIGEAAVVAREDVPGDKRLVAYVVPSSPDATPTLAALRQQLQRSLPSAMIPADLVVLGAMPVSVNGKLDRTRLPAPARTTEVTPLCEPRTEVERRIAGLWRAALGPGHAEHPLGRDQSFFDVGGDSIKIIRLHHDITAQFAVDLPVLELFRRPTIAALAELLDPGVASESPPPETTQDEQARVRDGRARRREQLRRRASQSRRA